MNRFPLSAVGLILIFAGLLLVIGVTAANDYLACQDYPDEPIAYVERIVQELIRNQPPPCPVSDFIDKTAELADRKLCVSIEPCEEAD